jgi:hypothetical protein
LFDGQGRCSEGCRYGFAGGEPGGRPAQQVSDSQRFIRAIDYFAGDLPGQCYEALGEGAVDFLRSLGRRPLREIEDLFQVEAVIGGHGTEAHQVRKQQPGASAGAEAIFVPDLGVSVPVGGVGEFDRYIDLGSGRRIMSAASGQDVVYEFLADEAREVVVDDDHW